LGFKKKVSGTLGRFTARGAGRRTHLRSRFLLRRWLGVNLQKGRGHANGKEGPGRGRGSSTTRMGRPITGKEGKIVEKMVERI